jgi:hypothetical protein
MQRPGTVCAVGVLVERYAGMIIITFLWSLVKYDHYVCEVNAHEWKERANEYICLAVGCDGISGMVEDACGICGGNGSTCTGRRSHCSGPSVV